MSNPNNRDTCEYCGHICGTHHIECPTLKASPDYTKPSGSVKVVDGCSCTRWSKQLRDGEYWIFILPKQNEPA